MAKRFVVSKKSLGIFLLFLYVFIITSLPDGIKSITALYKMSTADLPLMYTYYYYFSILEIPIIMLGLVLYSGTKKVIRFMPIFGLILALNITYAILGEESVFSLKSYEMLLLLATGFSGSIIALYFCKNVEHLDKAIDYFLVFNFLLQLLYMLYDKAGSDRVGAAGLAPGTLGFVAAMYLVWSLYMRISKPSIWVQIIAILTIFISGSRSHLFVIAFIIAVYILRKIGTSLINRKWASAFIYTFVGIVICVGVIAFFRFFQSDVVLRYYQLLSGDVWQNIMQDSSNIGRIRSNEGGFEILQNHPMGLPFSIYALERESLHAFNMEYPHSALLSYAILWSPPIALFCFGYLIWLSFRLYQNRKHTRGYLFILYYVLMLILYSAPVLYSKAYIFIFVMISYARCYALDNRYEKKRNPKLLATGGSDENNRILSPTVSCDSRK